MYEWSASSSKLRKQDLKRTLQDFGGFRTVLLVPRFRPSWPPPGVFDSEAPKKTRELGAPRCPLPLLLPKSKPVSAATVRCGPDYPEVPFFATHDSHRLGHASSFCCVATSSVSWNDLI